MGLVKFLLKMALLGIVGWAFVHFSAYNSPVVQTWNFIWNSMLMPIFNGIISLGFLPWYSKLAIAILGIICLMFGLMKKG